MKYILHVYIGLLHVYILHVYILHVYILHVYILYVYILHVYILHVYILHVYILHVYRSKICYLNHRHRKIFRSGGEGTEAPPPKKNGVRGYAPPENFEV